MENTFWISFVVDEVQSGVVIADGTDFIDAMATVNALGLNPGGEVMGFQMPDNPESRKEIAHFGKNRLISPEELEREHYRKLKDLSDEENDYIENLGTRICASHN